MHIGEITLDRSKRPRGRLVPDFLKSDIDAVSYMETVARHQAEYNLLNLVLLERRSVQLLCRLSLAVLWARVFFTS